MSIYDMASAIQPVDIVGNYQQGQSFGNALAEMRRKREQEVKAEEIRNGLAQFYRLGRPEQTVTDMQGPDIMAMAQQGAGMSAPMSGLGVMRDAAQYAPRSQAIGQAPLPSMSQRQIPATPSSFDYQGAADYLASNGDFSSLAALQKMQGGGGDQRKLGMEPLWLQDGSGNLVPGQLSSQGGIELAKMPEGYSAAPRVRMEDFGGYRQGYDQFGRPVGSATRKSQSPDSAVSNDPTIQAAVAEARAKGGAAGQIEGSADANANVSAEKSLPVIAKTLSIVSELESHPGRVAGTGGSSLLLPLVPGTPAHDFKIKLEQLTGQSFLSEVEKMRGLGTLTETEGRKLTLAAAALEASQSEPEFLKQLRIFRDELKTAQERHRARLSSKPGAAKPGAAAPGWKAAGYGNILEAHADYKKARDSAFKAGNTELVKKIDAEARKDGVIR